MATEQEKAIREKWRMMKATLDERSRRLWAGSEAHAVTGLIIDCVVERGNSTDSTKAQTLAKRASKALGIKPEQLVFDGGFSSSDNLAEFKASAFATSCFSKAPGIAIKEMMKRTWL